MSAVFRTQQSVSSVRVRHVLLIAMCVHLAAATGAVLAGRWALAPATFDKSGIASFASDSRVYLIQINALEKTLKQEGPVSWLRTPAPIHVKLYSLSFALFSPLFGQTILSAEPLNLIYFLIMLWLVFRLGREAFGEREGLLAAGMCVVLLPSFLLHSTQLLKDPLFIVLTLALVLVSVKWLTTEYTMTKGLTTGALGGAAAASLWLVKNPAWMLVLAIMFLGTTLAVAQQAWRRKIIAGNLLGVALMLVIALSVSYIVKPYWLPPEYWMPHRPAGAAPPPKTIDQGVLSGSTSIESANTKTSNGQRANAVWSRVARRVAIARSHFIELYPDAGSNLDGHVQFRDTLDVVIYVPRAMLIGLSAPFPSMWLKAGMNTGSGARLLSGFETLLMCLVQLLAFYSLWRRRRELPVWLLMLTALIGVTALGLVVVNIGALYRQRYLLWILFIVVGADTVARLLSARLARAKL